MVNFIFIIGARNRAVSILLVALLALAAPSCSTNGGSAFEPEHLESSDLLKEYTKEEVLALLGGVDGFEASFAPMVKYGVKAIRITYSTYFPNGTKGLASGLLLVPQTTLPCPLLSFQHGALFDKEDAPSKLTSPFVDVASVFASVGYVIALPDYIGYGVSEHTDHPFEHRASLATACRDMLRATYEYFTVKGLEQHGEKIFLTGYSEGGFATMATAKLIQEQHPNEFNIVGVTVGAGAYNKTEFARWVLEAEHDLEHINSFVWVLDVYNSLYPQLNRPYTDYFLEPWASAIAENGAMIPLPKAPLELFNPSFVEGVLSQTDSDFLSALADNNCYSWKPLFPMQLYHGTDDMHVPYINSQTAYWEMTRLGAPAVELITIEGGTHETSIADYLMGTFMFFLSL